MKWQYMITIRMEIYMAWLILHKLFQDRDWKIFTLDMFMTHWPTNAAFFVPSFQGHSRYRVKLGPPPEFRQPPISLQKGKHWIDTGESLGQLIKDFVGLTLTVLVHMNESKWRQHVYSQRKLQAVPSENRISVGGKGT